MPTMSNKRRKPWFGSLARFSAHSVSIRPACGSSEAMVKPISCQKERSTGHISLAVLPCTTNQRCVPLRSICAFFTCISTLLPPFAPVRWVVASGRATVPSGSEYSSPLRGSFKSGGTSKLTILLFCDW